MRESDLVALYGDTPLDYVCSLYLQCLENWLIPGMSHFSFAICKLQQLPIPLCCENYFRAFSITSILGFSISVSTWRFANSALVCTASAFAGASAADWLDLLERREGEALLAEDLASDQVSSFETWLCFEECYIMDLSGDKVYVIHYKGSECNVDLFTLFPSACVFLILLWQ